MLKQLRTTPTRWCGIDGVRCIFSHNLKTCQFNASLPPASIDSVFRQINTGKYGVIPWEPMLMHGILLVLHIPDVSSNHPS
jgi:hypothetical protein